VVQALLEQDRGVESAGVAEQDPVAVSAWVAERDPAVLGLEAPRELHRENG